MKTNKNPRQLRLDQRTYSTTADRATNQATMFWILILCVISNTSKNDSGRGSSNNTQNL